MMKREGYSPAAPLPHGCAYGYSDIFICICVGP